MVCQGHGDVPWVAQHMLVQICLLGAEMMQRVLEPELLRWQT